MGTGQDRTLLIHTGVFSERAESFQNVIKTAGLWEVWDQETQVLLLSPKVSPTLGQDFKDLPCQVDHPDLELRAGITRVAHSPGPAITQISCWTLASQSSSLVHWRCRASECGFICSSVLTRCHLGILDPPCRAGRTGGAMASLSRAL